MCAHLPGYVCGKNDTIADIECQGLKWRNRKMLLGGDLSGVEGVGEVGEVEGVEGVGVEAERP